MKMRALKVLDYNGRRLAAGETFEPASAGDGHILALAQLAVEADDEKPKPKKKSKYPTRRMQAEDE